MPVCLCPYAQVLETADVPCNGEFSDGRYTPPRSHPRSQREEHKGTLAPSKALSKTIARNRGVADLIYV